MMKRIFTVLTSLLLSTKSFGLLNDYELARMADAAYALPSKKKPKPLPAPWSYAPFRVTGDTSEGSAGFWAHSQQEGTVLSFRGSFTTTDWMSNLVVPLDACPPFTTGKELIHIGFCQKANALLTPLQKALENLKKKGVFSENLSITGHSQGGAMAILFSLLLKKNTQILSW